MFFLFFVLSCEQEIKNNQSIEESVLEKYNLILSQIPDQSLILKIYINLKPKKVYGYYIQEKIGSDKIIQYQNSTDYKLFKSISERELKVEGSALMSDFLFRKSDLDTLDLKSYLLGDKTEKIVIEKPNKIYHKSNIQIYVK